MLSFDTPYLICRSLALGCFGEALLVNSKAITNYADKEHNRERPLKNFAKHSLLFFLSLKMIHTFANSFHQVVLVELQHFDL